jgi:hypothetical protein
MQFLRRNKICYFRTFSFHLIRLFSSLYFVSMNFFIFTSHGSSYVILLIVRPPYQVIFIILITDIIFTLLFARLLDSIINIIGLRKCLNHYYKYYHIAVHSKGFFSACLPHTLSYVVLYSTKVFVVAF